MHHRHNRTTRREVKRLDHKAFRQAEKRGLDHPQDNVRTDMWGRGAQLPLPDDAPCNGKRHGRKKVRPSKAKCPAGGAHVWLYDWTVERAFVRDPIIGPCDRCIHESADWEKRQERYKRIGWDDLIADTNPFSYSARNWCRNHGRKVYYNIHTKIGVCVNCPAMKSVDRFNDRPSWRDDRKYILPKRTVQF